MSSSKQLASVVFALVTLCATTAAAEIATGPVAADVLLPNPCAVAISSPNAGDPRFATGYPSRDDQWWDGFSLQGFNGPVYALAEFDGTLIAGGYFSSAGGTPASYIAAWNGSSWSSLGSGLDGQVQEMLVYGAKLIVTGFFTHAGGVLVNYIAQWDGVQWTAIGTGFNDKGLSLAIYNADLIAGGFFNAAGGVAANRVARWNGAAWSAIGSGMDNAVWVLGTYGGSLIAGGWFGQAGGIAANHIAKWNGTAWSTMGSGVNATPRDFEISNGNLIVAGEFTQAGGVAAGRIASWNGVSWSAFGPGMDQNVYGVCVYDNALIAGGLFANAGTVPANHVARWDGTQWSPLGSGTDGPVEDVQAIGGALFAGGSFLHAGGEVSARIARWGDPLPCTTPETPTPCLPVCGGYTPAGNVPLVWSAAANATSYEYELFTNPDCSDPPAFAGSVSDTTYTWIGVPANVTYSWRVRARNNNIPSLCSPEGFGDWSSGCAFGTILSPVPTGYVDFNGESLSLYAWEGAQTVLQSRRWDLDNTAVGRILDATDSAYLYYQGATGFTPPLAKSYNGKTTISDVPSTCGAGCAYLGATGIEIQNYYFDLLYNGVRDDNEFDQVVFYEFGRNFWHLGPQIEYLGSDNHGAITTGFAVFMRFMAMDAAGVNGGPFGSWTFPEFRTRVEEMIDLYLADPTQTWSNTLRVGQPQANNPSGLGATDLFASFLFRLCRDYGGDAFVQQVWRECAARPAATTTQEAVDNFFLASCAAAHVNLKDLFIGTWRWPISEAAVNGVPSLAVGEGDGLTACSPNPFSAATVLRYRLPEAEAMRLEIFDVSGRGVWSLAPGRSGAEGQSVIWDGRDSQGKDLAPGVYFARLSMKDRNWTRRLVHVK
jgi:hypothetical protein